MTYFYESAPNWSVELGVGVFEVSFFQKCLGLLYRQHNYCLNVRDSGVAVETVRTFSLSVVGKFRSYQNIRVSYNLFCCDCYLVRKFSHASLVFQPIVVTVIFRRICSYSSKKPKQKKTLYSALGSGCTPVYPPPVRVVGVTPSWHVYSRAI